VIERAVGSGMDWKLFASAFGAIVLAEIGDRTRATLSLAAGARRPGWCSPFGAGAGRHLGDRSAGRRGAQPGHPADLAQGGAGALVIVLGIVFLLSRGQGGDEADDHSGAASASSDSRSSSS
jgi:putative Ca2+/H+ antiporter (TMEM165/GDT1 family)